MTISIPMLLMLLSMTSSPACRSLADGEVATLQTEEAAILAARQALRGAFGARQLKAHEPYRATLADGVWHVRGTLPTGMRGGTPEAEVCSSDGQVLRVFHTQ